MQSVRILSGSANVPLAAAVARELGTALAGVSLGRFPDGELDVALEEEPRDQDVYLIQPTVAPVGEMLLELLLLADACRRAGAARITAVLPYVGYARQDRRESTRIPLGARVMADVMGSGAIDRVVAMDLHSRAIEGCFRVPVEHVSAVDALAERLREGPRRGVVVSPDLGAVKLAERYARVLGLPVAVVHKRRISGAEVAATGVIGEVRGLAPIVVDDMVSTAGTLAAAIDALLAAGCVADVAVAVSHSLLVGPALERLARLPIRRFLTTDSVPRPGALPLQLEVVSAAPVLAEAIRRLAGHG